MGRISESPIGFVKLIKVLDDTLALLPKKTTLVTHLPIITTERHPASLLILFLHHPRPIIIFTLSLVFQTLESLLIHILTRIFASNSLMMFSAHPFEEFIYFDLDPNSDSNGSTDSSFLE